MASVEWCASCAELGPILEEKRPKTIAGFWSKPSNVQIHINNKTYCGECAFTRPIIKCVDCAIMSPTHHYRSQGALICDVERCCPCRQVLERKADAEYEWCRTNPLQLLSEFKSKFQHYKRFAAVTILDEKEFAVFMEHLKSTLAVSNRHRDVRLDGPGETKKHLDVEMNLGSAAWAESLAGTHPLLPHPLQNLRMMLTATQAATCWQFLRARFPDTNLYKFEHAVAHHLLLARDCQIPDNTHSWRRTKNEIWEGWMTLEWAHNVGPYRLDTCPICIEPVMSHDLICECCACHQISHRRCKFKMFGACGARCEICRIDYRTNGDLLMHDPCGNQNWLSHFSRFRA